MSPKINLVITPSGATANALAQAHKESQSNSASSESGKARRLKYEWKVPATQSALEIVRMEADGKTSLANYHCTGNPADYLIARHALSSGCHVAHVVPVQLALFKVALKSHLPLLEDSVLDSITQTHCKLGTLTIPYFFEFQDQTEAYRAWLHWYQHSKAVFDGANRLPTRTSTWRKPPVRVYSDADNRDSFIVNLPFGQARFSLMRDFGSYPAAKSGVQSKDERKDMLAHLHCLLRIEVTVELAKFFYIDSCGLDLQLPSDARLWVPSKMPEDPAYTIWKRFRWESWLDAKLLNEADSDHAEDKSSPLQWQMEEVATAYFAGEYLQRHAQIDADPKKFVKYREALIAKAGIDILNPWNIAKLNLGKELSTIYSYENRFLPQMHDVFAPYTLAKGNIGAAILNLNASLLDEPGWSFDTSPYEASKE